MAERMVEANGVELCTEPFGDPAHPPIPLITGIGASMLWWEEGFCRGSRTAGGSSFATTTATPGASRAGAVVVAHTLS